MSLIEFLLFLLYFVHIVESKKSLEPTLHHGTGDSEIYVFDRYVNHGFTGIVQQLLAANQSYSYFYPDPYSNPERKANDGNLHWSASMSPALLVKTKLWAMVKNCIQSLPKELSGGKRYLPYFAQGTMLRRGDTPTTFQGDPKHADSIFVRIFLSEKMKKNSYADQAFYDKDDEIVTSVHPKRGRIILWTGNVSTLMRPPSMEFEQAEFSMLLKLNADKNLFFDAIKKHDAHIIQSEAHAASPLPYTNQMKEFNIGKLDLSKNLLGKYLDNDGNVIAFFDDVLPKEILDELRRYVTNYNRGFSYNPYDPDSAETNDNVNWIIAYKIEKLLQTPVWEAIKVLAASITNDTIEWFPYDVSTNLIQHTMHTRIHIDCVHEEYELTFLLYLNPDWNENKYAETSFYNFVNKGPPGEKGDVGGSADEEYDFIAAAVPKFGRIAIFRNLIPHSARPPSPDFHAARYTFPVKVSESESHARAKMLAETLDKVDDATHPLYASLREGNIEEVLHPDKMEWIKTHYKVATDEIERHQKESMEQLEAMLVPERYRKT